MEQLKQQWQKFRDWFKSLSVWKKILVVGVPTALIITLLAVAYFTTPHYSLLFSNLDPNTLQKIEFTLSQLGINYKIDYKTGAVYVPADKVEQLRILLAEKGVISPEKKVGFEIFENQPLTVSDFVEHINYIRALEGELEKTIRAIDAVEDVKVNIALPRESIFARPEAEPKASVLIKLKPGAQLTPEQIKAIRDLVAASVVGLKPQNVVIVDQYGRDLTALIGDDTSVIGLATNQLKLKLKYEDLLQKQIQSILDSVVGFGNARVKVSLALDFAQRQEKAYEVNPDQTAVVSEQKKQSIKKTVSPEGVPGSESNVPPQVGKGQKSESVEKSKEIIKNYDVSYIQKLINDPTVKVERVSVGVIINSDVKGIDPQKIKEFLINALGLNPARGDTVTVVALPFKAKEELQKLFAQKPKEKPIPWKVYALIAFLLALVIAVVIYLLLRREKIKEEEVEIAVYGRMLGAPAGAAAVAQKAEETLTERLNNMAKANPELYKKLLLRWLKSS